MDIFIGRSFEVEIDILQKISSFIQIFACEFLNHDLDPNYQTLGSCSELLYFC